MNPLDRAEGINQAHGSPFDRGAADSYYRRGRVPHKMVNKTIIWLKPDSQEWLEYQEGYDINEEIGSFKEYE